MQRAKALAKAIIELRKLIAARRVSRALRTRNGPDVTDRLPLILALSDETLVYREKGG